MQKIRSDLDEFRRKKRLEQEEKEQQRHRDFAGSSAEPAANDEYEDELVDEPTDWDFLDALPFRLYRSALEARPRTTLAISATSYFIEFGAVFFIFAALLAIILSLGKRRDGEVSAYSVFNPNCERLLGQMTAEHFERDVLRRAPRT